MDQNAETEKARRTRKKKAAQAETKAVREREKKGGRNSQQTDMKPTKIQQPRHIKAQKNEETRTRRFGEAGNGKAAEKT